ncbi:MAG: antibiotic biosynthesis monooxygenase [Myxococcota bacterium]|nr:antibiotic biosynthesis monooxygenase [Myxococcales bacterium]
MVVVVFRSRLDESEREAYEPVAVRMLELAHRAPGFVSFRAYAADDGERLALAEFETAEHAAAWGREAEHLAAQRLGRERFYTEYRLQVAEVVRERAFRR